MSNSSEDAILPTEDPRSDPKYDPKYDPRYNPMLDATSEAFQKSVSNHPIGKAYTACRPLSAEEKEAALEEGRVLAASAWKEMMENRVTRLAVSIEVRGEHAWGESAFTTQRNQTSEAKGRSVFAEEDGLFSSTAMPERGGDHEIELPTGGNDHMNRARVFLARAAARLFVVASDDLEDVYEFNVIGREWFGETEWYRAVGRASRTICDKLAST